MAPKITSAAERSRRQKAAKTTVRTDKGRKNRQGVSTAKVTSGSNGKPANSGARVTNASQRTSSGSARVTGTPRTALPPAKPKPNSKPTRSSIGNVSGPASNPKAPQSPASPKAPVRASIGNVSGPASYPKAPGTNTSLKSSGTPRPPAAANVQRAAQPKPNVASAAIPKGAAVRRMLGGAASGATGIEMLLQGNREMQGLLERAGFKPPKGSRSQAEIAKMADRPKQGNAETKFPNARAEAQLRAQLIKASIPEPKSTNQGQASRASGQQRSSGGRTASPQPRQSPARPSQAAPRTSTGTAGTGRKWEDFNKGRGTSETNNPLISKDSWLMGKIKERENTQASNVGPTKSGADYASSKQAADIVARRKKKEEDDKKKPQS